uniref:DUF5727 domain-containing protein n=2 Tax=Schistocephalus solidus TaxID=70667 RepID=A0A0X3PGC4_SCHSO
MTVSMDDLPIQIWDTREMVCEWNGPDLINGDSNFCKLTFRNQDTEVWFNGIFHKGDRNNNTYQWMNGLGSVLSVSVDWTQTGEAPENFVCFAQHIIDCPAPDCAMKFSVFSGLLFLILEHLIYY